MSDKTDFARAAAHTGVRPSRGGGHQDTELLSPPTQVVSDRDAYLAGSGTPDIGRRVAEDQFELFVVCHPAEALQQQFAQLAPDFIAVHDLGCEGSTRLLGAVAAAASRKLNRLVIRRQGYGVALATLQFVELPLSAERSVRLYSTQIDADTQTRHQLAQTLLANSRLGVLMVGELPAHALDAALQPLRQAIAAGPWPNRQLLVVPLGHAPTLPNLVGRIAGGSDLIVRTTPRVARPADAWSYISGAWNRAQDAGGAGGVSGSGAGGAGRPGAYDVTQPADLAPMPPARPATVQPRSAHQGALWNEYVQRCASIKGLVHCCVVDLDLQRPLAYSGTQRMAERLAVKGAMLHAVMCDAADVLGLGPAPQPDASITLARHHLLVRPMPGRPRVALHLVLDRAQANLGLARAQVHQIDQALLGAAA